MDSHQFIVSPFKNLTVVSEPHSQKSEFGEILVHRKEDLARNSEGFIGVLEVCIHQARDIHNICIYHKQDVYAKLCLTSNPETTVSTQIINGGGKNPVFNENLKLNVQTIDSSLKCEIWMLSRVRNYMEDQLLGFALVPLSDVLIENGKLEHEFSLSSTDLFHSPAGFVQLSLYYSGASPEIMAIPTPRSSMTVNTLTEDSVPSDFDNIEFPDPKIVNENQMMVSEYFEISGNSFDSQNSECLNSSETDNHHNLEINVPGSKSFSVASPDSVKNRKIDTPLSSVSVNFSPSASVPESSQSFCDSSGASISPNQEQNSLLKGVKASVAESESESSGGIASDTFAQSVLKVNVEPEQTVVQQEIVDMYMKSMQQFTESLAKMKLPMDIEIEPTNLGSGNESSDKKLQASKGTGSRVFYGSRAFF